MKFKNRIISMLLCTALTSSLFVPTFATEVEAGADEVNLTAHYDMSIANGELQDQSGNEHHANMVEMDENDIVTDGEWTTLEFTGDKTQYIELPSGLLTGEDFTIQTVLKTSTKANHWAWCFGTNVGNWPNVKNYIFLNPMQGNGSIRTGINDATSEKLLTGTSLAVDTYEVLTFTYEDGVYKSYLNGEFQEEVEINYSVQEILSNGTSGDISGYIGRSLFEPDPAFTGSIADFQVYDGAMDETLVKALYDETTTPDEEDEEDIPDPETPDSPYIDVLPVAHYDMTVADGKLQDQSGSEIHAPMVGMDENDVVTDGEWTTLEFTGDKTQYIELPSGLLTGEEFTIQTVFQTGTSANHWLWCFGTTEENWPNVKNYIFLNPMQPAGSLVRTGMKDSNTEVLVNNFTVEADTYETLTVTYDGSAYKVYLNGILQGESDVDYSVQDILSNGASGTEHIGYLGKSLYLSDPAFEGSIADFQVYEEALNPWQVAELYSVTTGDENVDLDINLVTGGFVGEAPEKGTTGLDEHTVVYGKLSDDGSIFESAVRKYTYDIQTNTSTETDLTNISLTFDFVDSGVELEVDGKSFTNGDKLDLSSDVTVVASLDSYEQEILVKTPVIATNAVLPGQFADPDIDKFGDKYWIFPTTDGFSGWSGTQFAAFSADDLSGPWQYEGVILDVNQNADTTMNTVHNYEVPKSEWSYGSAWAPSIEEKDGKYYFYYCAKLENGSSSIGVAVADTPEGPYVPQSEPLITQAMSSAVGLNGQAIDPSILTLEDGTSYMYYGNGYAAVVKLGEDMMSLDGEITEIRQTDGNTLKDFRESVTVEKVGDLYHFLWSEDDTGSPNYRVQYGVSENPLGPVTYKYLLMDRNDEADILGSAHQSTLLDNDGRVYIAYHRFYTPLGTYTSGLGYHRETCIDEIGFDAYGFMLPLEPTLEGTDGEQKEKPDIPTLEGYLEEADGALTNTSLVGVVDDSNGGSMLHYTAQWNNQGQGYSYINGFSSIVEDGSFTLALDINPSTNEYVKDNGSKRVLTIGNSTNYFAIVPRDVSGESASLIYKSNGGELQTVSMNALPKQNDWSSLAVSYEENSGVGSVCVYLNGEMVIENQNLGFALSEMSNLEIDARFARGYDTNYIYHGYIDQITCESGAKTSEELVSLTAKRAVLRDKADLELVNLYDVRGNMTLPTEGASGSEITWTSSDSSIITDVETEGKPAGVVTRYDTTKRVALTATIKNGDEQETKTFTATVTAQADSLDTEYDDIYLWSHFSVEDGYEQIFFGSSENGLNWNKLNNNEAVLENIGGDLGVRDPQLIRSPEGDRYWIIGTDLHAEGGGAGGSGWDQARASQNLVIWESNDLVNWSDARLAFAGFDFAGCVWAPEAIYDETTGEYLVYWAARDQRQEGTDDWALRVYLSRTRDFVTFTEPEVWLEEHPHNIIDTTIVYNEDEGKYYRFSTSDWNTVLDVSDSLNGEWTRLIERGESKDYGLVDGVEGIAVYQLPDGRWAIMGDHNGYIAYVTDDLSTHTFTKLSSGSSENQVSFDSTFRHGSVLRLSTQEAERILEAYGNDEETAQDLAEEIAEGLTVPNSDDIRGNITLPSTAESGATITWESSNEAVISTSEVENTDYDNTPAGVVTRQDVDTEVTLTATVKYLTGTATKEIKCTVKAAPTALADEDFTEYFFVGFASDSDENIYFSASEDGLMWDDLNYNEPVITTDKGTGGLRDPHIIRSPEGDKFYMIATDLKVNDVGWGAAQSSGSQSIFVWESTDLVNWTDERLVEISAEISAGCTWAPESVYDPVTGEYIVFWASKTATNNTHRMFYAKTRDFYTFTEPEILMSRDWNVIDTTIIQNPEDGLYYRYTKNENGNAKYIFVESTEQILSENYTEVSSPSLKAEQWVEGPTIFKVNPSDLVQGVDGIDGNADQWCIWLDDFGGKGYYPLLTNDLSTGEFVEVTDDVVEMDMPSSARHGTVLPVTNEEYTAIMETYGSESIVNTDPEEELPVISIDFEETQDKLTLNGNARVEADSENGSNVLVLDGTSGTFAEFEQGWFDGRNKMTISMDIKSEMDNGNFFTFTIGQNSTKYMFLRTRENSWSNVISTNAWSGESGVSFAPEFEKGTWHNLKLVIDNKTMKMYVDNVLVAENDEVRTLVSDLGRDLIAYIGKSFYGADGYFKGSIDNIEIYNRALSHAEIIGEDSAVYNITVEASENGSVSVANDVALEGDQVTIIVSPDSGYELDAITVEDADGANVTVSDNKFTMPAKNVTIKATFKAREVAEAELFIHYDFDSIEGSVIKDASGNAIDGTLSGSTDLVSDGTVHLDGSAYIEIPKGTFTNQNELTIHMWMKNETGKGNYAAMFFGTEPPTGSSYPRNYWLFNPSNPNGQFKSVITNADSSAPWSTEVGISPTNSSQGVAGVPTDSNWHLYTTVITEDAISAYYDGEYIGSYDVDRTVSDFGADLVSYIGKSEYPDKYLNAYIGEVKVYKGEQVADDIKAEYAGIILEEARDTLSLEYTTVRDNITLPNTGKQGVDIDWSSSNEGVVSSEGIVTRPNVGEADVSVKLTASLSCNGVNITKEFEITVLAQNPQGDLEAWVNSFELGYSFVTEDVILPTTYMGTVVTWKSNGTALSSDGKVTRPYVGNGNVVITLTADFEHKDDPTIKESKTFKITVCEAEYATLFGYVMNGSTDRTDALHLALGDLSGNIQKLNNGRPVLYSNQGENRLSNPILFRKSDGAYGLIASDGHTNMVVVYDSADLLTYSNQNYAKLTDEHTSIEILQCEYNTANNMYSVIYSSGNAYYSVNTESFVNFTAPVEVSGYTVTEHNLNLGEDDVSKLGITKAEYTKLLQKYGRVVNTSVTYEDKLEVELGAGIELPQTAQANYSDGSSKTFPIVWDTDSLAKINTNSAGTYTVTGKLNQPEYAEVLVEQRADPWVIKGDDGYYYFTGSYPVVGNSDSEGYDRLVLRRSETLEGLATAEEVVIWDESSSSVAHRYIWAPELHKIGDTWYMLFTAGTSSNNVWSIRPFFLECMGEDLMDPNNWTTQDGSNLHRAQALDGDSYSFTGFSLDMNYFEVNGEHYVIWAQTAPSSLYMATINPEQPWKLTSMPMLLTEPEFGWEWAADTVNEGAATLIKDGKVYVFFSAASTDYTYCVSVMTADVGSNLMNPNSWTKNPYPLLTSNDFEGQYGPGHNSLTFDENGNLVIVYHARPYECDSVDGSGTCGYVGNGHPLNDPCRHARIKSVNFAVDGTPILNMLPEEELNPNMAEISVEIKVISDSSGSGSGGGSGGGSSGGGSEDEKEIEDEDTPLSELGFTDVLADDWFYEAIMYAVENSLFNGVSDTEFAPNTAMNRAMMWTVLARIEGVDTTGGGEWYSKGMEWAMGNEVSDGTDPMGNLTREQLVTMLYRYAAPEAVTMQTMLDQFTDNTDISEYAVSAMEWAVANGIITGVTDTEIQPQGEATRAQVATILMRYLTKE